MVLVRDGFVFSPDNHAIYGNLIAVSASATMVFSAGSKTISRPSGSFVTEGFVVGNRVTSSSALNPGPFTLTAVTPLEITVSETVINETTGVVITAHDELPNGSGYATGGEPLVGLSLTEDDADNRAELVFNDLTWTAAGADLGPTAGAIIYDGTTGDNTILGFYDFGSDHLIADGHSLVVKSNEIRIS
jgi:hypothetical protein